MGNIGSSGSGNGRRRSSSNHHHRRRHHHHHPPPPHLPPPPSASLPPPETTNRYVYAAATAPHYPNPGQYYPHPPPQYPGYYPTMPFDPRHHQIPAGPHHAMYPHYYPFSSPPPAPAPFVEHQKAKTIRNVVNLKKETLRLEQDEDHPGTFLISFTFDAEVDGSITILFFAKEGEHGSLMAMKESLLKPVTVPFKEGLAQKFQQPSGSGINFSIFEEAELVKEGEIEVYPLAVKAEASPDKQGPVESQDIVAPNSQITQAVFDRKENNEYRVRVVKQILWMDGTRYELQEIYGIGNSVDSDFDGNDSGKECVICLSEPRDTTILPCRHMCLCSECAKVLRYQTNRCPICRQPVERLLEIEVNNNGGDEQQQQRDPGQSQAMFKKASASPSQGAP